MFAWFRALGRAIPCAVGLCVALAAVPALAQDEAEGFHFGSYGRMRAATDLRGGGPRDGNFVAHGSRLDESPYAELELRNTQYPEKGMRVRVISTVAFAGDPFHYTGNFTANIAVRNMFVDVRGLVDGLTVWAGARMYRGDDIYLLDFWPLDNLNTVGGGAIYDVNNSTRVQLHVGTNRLLNGNYQYQERNVPNPYGVGSVSAVTLDRPRTIASAKITQFFPNNTAQQGFKASLYGEGHLLPSGIYDSSTTIVTPGTYYPSDNGFVLGAQGTAYGFGSRDGFVHLFVRYARGIAAYGDLAVPFGLDSAHRATSANELMIAAAGNYQWDRFALLMGTYVRRFRDAADSTYSNNHFWEGILSLRPYAFTTKHTGVAMEGSYQFRDANVLDNSGHHRMPQAFRWSLMPFISPWGMGVFQRPIIYAVYTATIRNTAAQQLYPAEDPRATRSVEHYLGLGAEWWFNSSSYP